MCIYLYIYLDSIEVHSLLIIIYSERETSLEVTNTLKSTISQTSVERVFEIRSSSSSISSEEKHARAHAHTHTHIHTYTQARTKNLKIVNNTFCVVTTRQCTSEMESNF